MTNKQFDNIVRCSARMEEFELTEHMKSRLRETIENPVSRKKMHSLTLRTVLMAMLIVLMLSAVAYAAATNPTIIEIYTKWFGADNKTVKTLSEQTVQTPELGYALDDITIQLTQVIFDGNTLYTTGTVSAKETSNVVILADDYQPRDPANADFHRSSEDFSKSPTYLEVAQQKGAKLLHTYVWVEAEGGDGSYMNDNIPLKDGSYSFITEFPDVKVTGDSIPCTIGALQYEVNEDGIEVPGTRTRKDWFFTVPAIAKEIRTPVPTPVLTPMPADVQSQALIVAGDSPDSMTAKFYKAAYPGAPVVYSNTLYDENGVYHATQMILDGTSEWDVMCITTGETDLPLLMESGRLADLSGYDWVMGKASALYPSIKNALMKDGKLYALPGRIFSRDYACGSYSMDTDVWGDLGFTQSDIPKTIDELCDFIDKWLQRPKAERDNVVVSDEGASYSYHAWLLDLLLDRYIDYYDYAKETPAFDTALFTRLLARIGEVSARIQQEEKVVPGTKVLLNLANPLDDTTRIAPLGLSKDHPYLKSSDMIVYIVNANSKHLEQAIAYAQCGFITPSDEQRIWMYDGLTLMDLPNLNYDQELNIRDQNVAHWQEEVEKAKKESDLEKAKESLARALFRRDKAETKVFAIDANDLVAYQYNIAPHLFFPTQRFYYKSGDAWLEMDNLKKSYLTGKMTAAAFAKALDELVAKLKTN